jgi:hypothetical protein
VIAALVLGALGGVDRTAFAQSLLANPIVCGTLAGWWAGDPGNGLRLGIVFALLESRRSPIGGGGPVIDWTSAAVAVPVALGASAASWQWGLGLVAGLALALVGGRWILLIRELAARMEPTVALAGATGSISRIEAVHLRFLGLHLLRGAGWTVLGVVLVGGLAFDVSWSGPGQALGAVIWGYAPVLAATVLVLSQRHHAGNLPVALGFGMGLLLVLAAGVGS